MIDDIDHDLGLLRSLMARELETINHYRSLAESAAEGPAREFFLHVVDEEKLHVAEVLRAIARYDADQSRLLESGFASGHVPGEVPSTTPVGPAEKPRVEAARETSSAPVPSPRSELTVGSLRGKRQEL